MWIFVRLESAVIETLIRGVGLKIDSVGMAGIHCNIILVSWGEVRFHTTEILGSFNKNNSYHTFLAIFIHNNATRSIFLVCIFFKKKISKNFRFSTTVNEYLTLGSLFAIFEPWIWRRLGLVPACYCSKLLTAFFS